MEIRVRYVFTGWVQGVGFRYRAYHAANSLGLTGWVQNEYDGSVTLEVQGRRNRIETMLQAIENGRYIRIDAVKSRELPPVPDESSFEICD